MLVALGREEKFILNGSDYSTPDGTCVRDYIHVLDLAVAHLLALDYLEKRQKSECFNVATGQGYSNKEIIEAVKRISGVDFQVEFGPRREGDPAMIYADNTKIKKMLGWTAEYSDLRTIIETAWQWHKSHSGGFKN
jgi:UDP-glucose 4-epimerase